MMKGLNMGMAKRAMMEHEENLQQAAAYLAEKGVLEQCPYHEEIYGGDMDLDDTFWRFAMADRNRGVNGPVPWASGMKAREYTDILKSVYDDHLGDECGYCARNRDE